MGTADEGKIEISSIIIKNEGSAMTILFRPKVLIISGKVGVAKKTQGALTKQGLETVVVKGTDEGSEQLGLNNFDAVIFIENGEKSCELSAFSAYSLIVVGKEPKKIAPSAGYFHIKDIGNKLVEGVLDIIQSKTIGKAA